MSAAATPAGETTTITATCVGAKPADTVRLYAILARRPVLVDTASVDSAGVASFAVPTPTRRRTYVVVLVATRDHTAAKDRVVLTAG